LGALHRVLDHGAEGIGHFLVGQRLGQVGLVAEDEVQREHARLRRHAGGVRGGGDDEVDIARSQLLQRLRLSSQLRARELVDAELAAAQRLQLLVEDAGGDAIGGSHRLVIGEAQLTLSRGIAPEAQDQGARGQGCEADVFQGDMHGVTLPV
jgi:hypothetical protein